MSTPKLAVISVFNPYPLIPFITRGAACFADGEAYQVGLPLAIAEWVMRSPIVKKSFAR
jgi:hypothetical protein